MLKTRDLYEVPTLFELLLDPKVYPFVRDKAESIDEYYFLTKKTIEAEYRGELISRTILDEYEKPIGTINLYDIYNNYGFLATWLGSPYFGKGYNQIAKEQFFNELFYEKGMEGIFMKVRRINQRSIHAAMKLPYVSHANYLFPENYEEINKDEDVFELFVITKEHYTTYLPFTREESTGDEEVS